MEARYAAKVASAKPGSLVLLVRLDLTEASTTPAVCNKPVNPRSRFRARR